MVWMGQVSILSKGAHDIHSGDFHMVRNLPQIRFFLTTTSVRAAKWPGSEFNATLMSLLVDIRHHKHGGWQRRRRDDQDLDPRITRLQTFHLQSGLGHIWFLCFWNETTVPEVQPCGSCWDQTQTPPDYNVTTINISPCAACEFSPLQKEHTCSSLTLW